MKSKKLPIVLTSLVVVLAGGGALAHQHFIEGEGGNTGSSHVELLYEADFSVDANLAGGAEDLFYGKVLAVEGQKDLGLGAETQYSVEVQRVFKGDVLRTVVVNQQGGKNANGEVVDLPEGDALLKPGKRYLFATKYNPEHRFNTVIPVYGDQLIPDNEAPVSGVADADGDGRTTMSDRWEIAVKNQTDLSAVPSEPEPTEEPADDPPVEPSPGAP
ncbi:hypothetical protein ACFVW2_30410 [Streptomyces sp. NPDC058171]